MDEERKKQIAVFRFGVMYSRTASSCLSIISPKLPSFAVRASTERPYIDEEKFPTDFPNSSVSSGEMHGMVVQNCTIIKLCCISQLETVFVDQ